MNWVAEVGVVLVTLAVLAVPGGGIAWVLGLRGYALVAAAAPTSIAVIAVAALVDVIFPFRWGIISFLLAALALALVAWIYGRVARRYMSVRDDGAASRERGALFWPLIAAAVAVVVLVPRLAWVIADPSSISQTFDNIYHLNSVEYVLQHGQIAPTRQLIPGFYPSAWHALTALIAGITSAPVPVAVNAVSLVLGGVVWPIATVFLVWQIVGRNRIALIAAGVFSAATAAFPLLMLDFGVLYPNVLSIVLLPSALGILISVARQSRVSIPAPYAWLMLLAWVPSMALSHPSTLMAFLGIGFWPALWGGVRYFRTREWARETRVKVIVSAVLWVAGLAIAVIVFITFRPTREQAFWLPTTTIPDAVLQVLSNSATTGVPAIALSVLMIAGIIAIVGWQRSRLWLVLSFATLATVYIVGVAYPPGGLRYLLTGTWYSDMVRVAALMPTLAIPLAAIGAAGVAALVHRATSTRDETGMQRRRWPAYVTIAASTAVLLGTQLGPAMSAATTSARASYEMNAKSPLLSPDEEALLLRLPEMTPEDAVIVGNPWTGTSLSYAIGQRWAMVPHIYQLTTDDMTTILLSLNRAIDDPAVCAAIDRVGATHVLDFGSLEVHGAEHIYDGLTDLEESGVVRLIDSEGRDARLYEIVACR